MKFSFEPLRFLNLLNARVRTYTLDPTLRAELAPRLVAAMLEAPMGALAVGPTGAALVAALPLAQLTELAPQLVAAMLEAPTGALARSGTGAARAA